MAKYDYKLAKYTVQKYSDLLDYAVLGLKEDWGSTAEVIYENGKFEIELDNEPYIVGICGSIWATPELQLVFKDGRVKCIDCYTGMIDPSKTPDFFKKLDEDLLKLTVGE